jgi:hypothetical protein
MAVVNNLPYVYIIFFKKKKDMGQNYNLYLA